MIAEADRSDTRFAPLDTGPGAHDGVDTCADGHVAAAAPRWLRFGITAALGVVAGTMLFATEAHGRRVRRKEQPND